MKTPTATGSAVCTMSVSLAVAPFQTQCIVVIIFDMKEDDLYICEMILLAAFTSPVLTGYMAYSSRQ